MGLRALLILVIAVATAIAFVVWQRRRWRAVPNAQGIASLRHAFLAMRQPGEADPHCVVALEKRVFSFEQFFLAATDRRWIVMNTRGAIQAFDGVPDFMRVFHGPFSDGSVGYEAQLVRPDMLGRVWRLYDHARGYESQRRELRALLLRVGLAGGEPGAIA